MPENNKYVIWTLNAAENLINEKILNINFDNGKFLCGNRFKYDQNNKKSKIDLPHNLMPETEYFVPIAAKCLGDRLSDEYINSCKDKNVKTKLINIIKYFYPIWSQEKKRKKYKIGKIYRSFWEIGSGPYRLDPDKSSMMLTQNWIGYYDILKEAFIKTGRKNVLIGYSQGGLVARYLCWLSEYLFKEDIIEAVITVQSPNFGSPLANSGNADRTVGLFLTAFASLFSFYKYMFPEFQRLFREN